MTRAVDALRDHMLSALTTGRLHLKSGVHLARGVVFLGFPIVSAAADSRISIGSRSLLISRSRSTALGVGHPVILRTLFSGAEIAIGEDCGISGATICAARSVRIGNRALLGADVLVTDTDFHPVDDVPRRHASIPAPREVDEVVIDDDVFVGARSLVLKGSRIGRGTVIGAGSVVTGDVPAGVVAAGNPCRVIRPLEPTTPRSP